MAREAFPLLETHPEAEARRKPRKQAPFLRECRSAIRSFPRSSDLSQPRKVLYRVLVEGASSDSLRSQLDLSEEDFRSIWSWAPASGYLDNDEYSLTWSLVRNALPLRDKLLKWDLVDSSDCLRCSSGAIETCAHALFHCCMVRPLWDYVNELTARLQPHRARLELDVGYVCDNIAPPLPRVERMVFLTLLAVARKVVWNTRPRGDPGVTPLSTHDLIIYFKHQLKVKIRCDRKRLTPRAFSERWVRTASLVSLLRSRFEWCLPA